MHIGIDFGSTEIRFYIVKSDGSAVTIKYPCPAFKQIIHDNESGTQMATINSLKELIASDLRVDGRDIKSFTTQWFSEKFGMFCNQYGEPINSVAISVPPIFTENQRYFLKKSLSKASNLNIRLINDHDALLLGLNTDNNSTIGVLTIGATYTIFSIYEFLNGSYNLKASKSKKEIGGFQFNKSILGYILQKEELNSINEIQKNRIISLLYEKIEDIKIKILTKKDSVNLDLGMFVNEPEFSNCNLPEIILDYNTLIRIFDNNISQIIELIDNTFNLKSDQLNKLYLTGRGSRIELLSERISSKYNIPLEFLEIDYQIAKGASVFAIREADSMKMDEIESSNINIENKNDSIEEKNIIENSNIENKKAHASWGESISQIVINAEKLWNSGNYLESIENINYALSNLKDISNDMHYALSQYHLTKHHLLEAKQIILPIIQSFDKPKYKDLYNKICSELYVSFRNKNQLNEAELLLKEQCELDPDNKELKLALSNLRQEIRQVSPYKGSNYTPPKKKRR